MQTSRATKTALRQGISASALLSGPVLGYATFRLASLANASVGIAAFLALGCVLGGVTLWGILRAIYSLTEKLDTATSDPFGLQYQKREWWEASRPRFLEHQVPLVTSYDDGEDKT